MQAHSLIRAKAIQADKDVLAHAVVGYLRSWASVHLQSNPIGKDEHLNLYAHMSLLADVIQTLKITDVDFNERTRRKQPKLMRQREKFEKADRVWAIMAVVSVATKSGTPSS